MIFCEAAIFTTLVAFSANAAAQIILVDHQPHPYGGPGSDTLFPDAFGRPVWQRVADDFVLAAPDQAIALTFWGFYNADNPPAVETIRIRILGARAGDTLPDEGNVLSETSVLNPLRVWTGRFVGTGILPKEYRYEASLSAPVSLMANTKYWLEVVQIGDITTTFRWETSVRDDIAHAFINNLIFDWRPSSGGDQAFQLVSPEPASLAMLAIGFDCLWRRRKSRREASEWEVTGRDASMNR
jgi:hypothetical protein